MSDFVNLQKRGIELPAGCKDLIDLLTPPKEAHILAEGLAHIERYLSRLLQSPAQQRSVWITAIAPPVGVVHSKGSLKALIFLTTERKESISDILDVAGIQSTNEAMVAGNGPLSHFIFCSLPVDATSAARLVSELLEKGYGLAGDVQLHFRYREKSHD